MVEEGTGGSKNPVATNRPATMITVHLTVRDVDVTVTNVDISIFLLGKPHNPMVSRYGCRCFKMTTAKILELETKGNNTVTVSYCDKNGNERKTVINLSMEDDKLAIQFEATHKGAMDVKGRIYPIRQVD